MTISPSSNTSLTAGNFVSSISRREPTSPVDVPTRPAHHLNLAFESTKNPYDPAARACLHALIVRRLVSLDIDGPIDLFTPLDLAEPLAGAPSSYFLFAERSDA